MERHELLIHAQHLLNGAVLGYELNDERDCLDHLGDLYDLLDDVVGSKARDKCESKESHKD